MGASCTYVLGFKKAGAETGHRKRGWEVQVFDTATIDLQLLLLKFRLREVVEYLDYAWGLAASVGSVLVLGKYVVDVCDTDRCFKYSFGKGILKDGTDIAAAHDGQILTLETGCVHKWTKWDNIFSRSALKTFPPVESHVNMDMLSSP